MRDFAVLTAIVLLFAVTTSCPAQADATTTATNIDSEIFTVPYITGTMRRACDYQIANTTATYSNNWIRSAFYTGVMATYYTTGDRKYLQQAINWGTEANWTPNPRDPRHADNQCCGQTYAELYALEKDPAMIAGIRQAVDQMMATPKPGRVDWWWCDALFMAPPMLVRLASVTSETKYVDFMNSLYWDTTDFLFDSEEGLFYRDASYFGKRTNNGKKVFWSRGNGWVIAGIARLLDYLPENDPHRRDFVKLFLHMASSISRLQRADGMWGPSLHDPREFPVKESSGSGFFCFALAWGINNGVLDRERYQPVVEKAWQGLQTVLDENGKVGYAQKVAGAPGSVDPAATAEYAVGAFLLAGSEVIKLMNPDFEPAVVPPGLVGQRHEFDLFRPVPTPTRPRRPRRTTQTLTMATTATVAQTGLTTTTR